MCMRKHTEDYQTHACGYNVRTAVCGVVHYIVLCGDAQQFTRSCSQVQYSAMQRKATRHILLIYYTLHSGAAIEYAWRFNAFAAFSGFIKLSP